jgi:hypothetical protein
MQSANNTRDVTERHFYLRTDLMALNASPIPFADMAVD